MTAVSQHTVPPMGETTSPEEAVKGNNGWRACLALEYAAIGGRSLLLRQERQGPLFVQKPFYPEGPETCHTYIVHPPGGVVGGDQLRLDTTLGTGSRVLITTPAATKFYRSAGPEAAQVSSLAVGADAVLEWLPQETIVYNGARARMQTIVRLAPGGRFIGWEMICLGLPACAQPFSVGEVDQRFEIWQDDRPLLIDTLRIGTRDPILEAPWGMAGHPVSGILAATIEEPRVIDTLRQEVTTRPSDGLFAVTRVSGLILCRFLGDDVYTGLKLFSRAWEVLRPAVRGSDACAPRIWAT